MHTCRNKNIYISSDDQLVITAERLSVLKMLHKLTKKESMHGNLKPVWGETQKYCVEMQYFMR